MMKKILLSLSLICFIIVVDAQNSDIQKLWKDYQKGKYEQVITEAKILLEKDTNNIEINHLIGRAYFGMGNYDDAIYFLEKSTHTNDPKSYTKAWAYNFLGKCCLQKNDLELAKNYFYKSYNMRATKNVTNSSYGYIVKYALLDKFDDWTKIESDNFIFYFQKNENTDLFISKREFAFDTITRYLNVKPEYKIRYFVWSSRKDAKKTLKRNLGFALPHNLIIHSAYNQTKGHEMTHVISHYLHNKINKTGLINEGIAVHLDFAEKNDKDLVLAAMTKFEIKKIDIKSFWNEWDSYSHEVSYPLAGLFVGELIKEFGKEKFMEFFQDQTYSNAKKVYGNELNAFIKEFEEQFI